MCKKNVLYKDLSSNNILYYNEQAEGNKNEIFVKIIYFGNINTYAVHNMSKKGI